MAGSVEAGLTKEQLLIINGAGCQVINTAWNPPNRFPDYDRTQK